MDVILLLVGLVVFAVAAAFWGHDSRAMDASSSSTTNPPRPTVWW